jgi:signal transduction histidine kinase
MTLVLLLVTLVVFNGAGVFLYVRTQGVMEAKAEEDLITLGSWAVTEMRRCQYEPEDIPWINTSSTEISEYQTLLAQMKEFVASHSLERLIIYDRSLRVKLDTSGEIPIDGKNPYTVVDRLWIDNALAGAPTATPNYRVKENRYMRVYVPLMDVDPSTGASDVTGLLSVEAQRRYFQPLLRLRNFMFLVSGIVSGALLAIALVAHWALRRFVQLEESLDRADRLQTLGTLAAGMAHEIRNPLGIIRITTETLRSEIRRPDEAPDPDRDRLCQDVLDEVDRVHGLIGRFLSFARPSDARSEEPALVAEVVRHAVRLVSKAATAGQRVTIDLTIDEALDGAVTPLPAASLQQVLFNLLRNAQEAMEEAKRSGTVRVNVTPGPGEATISIAVSDEGVGMTPAQVRRAGEPFQTTKPEGTGLGLSITKNLLASVQGRLEIVSRTGEGTTVTAILPIAKTPRSAVGLSSLNSVEGEGSQS